MFVTEPDGSGGVAILPVAPPPPAIAAAAPPPAIAAAAPPAASTSSTAAQLVNANGETLAQAKAAVLNEVAQGATPSQALADHPLPQGSVTANEALDFLASLPQSSGSLDGSTPSAVTGAPIDTLPGYDPATHSVIPPAENAPADPSVDVGGTGGGERSLESAYKPAGVVAQWRNLVDVFKIAVPKQHTKVHSASQSLLEVFR